jgi:hypothetical protein
MAESTHLCGEIKVTSKIRKTCRGREPVFAYLGGHFERTALLYLISLASNGPVFSRPR